MSGMAAVAARRVPATDSKIERVLHQAHAEFGALTPELIEGISRREHFYIGDVLRIFAARPSLQIRTTDARVHVCVGKVCMRAGANQLADHFGSRGFQQSQCLGLCQHAPTVISRGKLVHSKQSVA
jgi:NADH:ubiquinone oxidoreductase subunit E